MNDQYLESCLQRLKSSACEPENVNERLEERIMEEYAMVQVGNRRSKRIKIALMLLVICSVGFLAAGGDAAVVNGVAGSFESTGGDRSQQQNKSIPKYQPIWKMLMHHVHDHIRSFHSSGQSNGQSSRSTLEQ